MSKARLTSRLVLILTLSLLPLLAFAATPDNPEPVGHMSASASGISWATGGDFEKITLRVMTPDGALFERDYTSAPSFRLQDLGGKIQDGKYTYELRITPKISDSVKQQLAAAREAGDDAAAEKIQRAAGIGRELMQSGTLTVTNGSFANGDAIEPPAGGGGRVKAATSTGTTAAVPRKISPEDIVQADDVIIQGSLCVGLDCVNNESFGFDTIRLKENNTRIKFDDTSTSTGFANHDWQLTANDSASGGANKFSIEDITAATVPMTITGSAPTNSIFVDSSGRVGFHTATPVLDLHVATGNTPAMRIEQNTSGGFAAQTWDVAGNEANFFVRDVTGGSRLPFRIRPGAPTSSIDISASGNVGVGTASPSERLHALNTQDAQTVSEVENASSGTSAAAIFRAKSDLAQLQMTAQSSTRAVTRFGQAIAGWNEIIQFAGNGLAIGTTSAVPLILGTNNVNRLQIDSAGAVTVSGNFTVTGVKNFAMPDPANQKRALYYTSLEGPEAGTYFRGTAKTVDGVAVIELPGYFSRITEKERMTVQLTPVGDYGQLYVAEKTPGRLVIKTAQGTKDQEFDFLVQGIRLGYLNYEVDRENTLPKQ
jgi:hypothetical protein